MSQETAITQYELGSTKLFQPIKIGHKTLKNRIFFPPTTRLRAAIDGTPSDLAYEYYTRRSENHGGLIITEGTFLSAEAGGMAHVPGIYTDAHVQAWKKIVSKVHENGTAISVQLFNLGRTAYPSELKRLGVPLVGPSAIYFDEESKKAAIDEGSPLKELTIKEIENFKRQYVKASKDAIHVAGFDFIELHDAHGYFLDQFLFPSSNKRTDKYGGSIENRARLVLEIIDLLIPEIGADKIGIRFSPWATFQGMLAEKEEVHPIAQIGYVLGELEKRKIAYVSLVEPRVSGIVDVAESGWGDKSTEFASQIFKCGVILKAGNYLGDKSQNFPLLRRDMAKNDNTLFGFSRFFTSNPDLVHKLEKGLELTPYERSHFYTHDNLHYDTFRGLNEQTILDGDKETKRVPVALVQS